MASILVKYPSINPTDKEVWDILVDNLKPEDAITICGKMNRHEETHLREGIRKIEYVVAPAPTELNER